MDSERFRKLLDTPGPFVSVYFEDTHNTPDAEELLELRWRALREELENQGVTDAVTGDIERAVIDLRPPVGWSGRGVVAGADGVVVNEHLLRSTATTVVRVSELPYIVPIVEHGFVAPDYLLVEVDHTGADITHTSTASSRPKPSTAAAIRCTKPRAPKPPDTETLSSAPTKPRARTSARWPTVSPSWWTEPRPE